MYKLLIVDDEPLVQAGVRSMLDWNELQIEVCGTAANGKAALELIEQLQPDIVITDLKMPIMTGIELIKECRSRYGYDRPAFIILTNYEDFSMAKEALQAQVVDYLIKIELDAPSLRGVILGALKRLQDAVKEAPPAAFLPMQNLSDKFYMCLLQDLFESEQQFLHQAEELRLSFSYEHYYCAYLELCPLTVSDISFEKMTQLYNGTLQMVKELLGKYLTCHIVSLDVKHLAVIIYSSQGETVTAKSIHNALHSVSETIRSYYNVALAGGISTAVNAPLEIADAFQTARQAASFASDAQPIYYFDASAPETQARRQFNLSLFKNDLSAAFDAMDEKAFEQILREILDLFSAHSPQYLQLLDCASSLLYLSMSLLPNGEATLHELYSDVPNNYLSLYAQSTPEQVMEWISSFRDRIQDYMKSHKKEYRNHIVESVKAYVTEHIREKLTLNDVANAFLISSSYLSQLFKKYNDMGFNEYVTYRKICVAKELLSSSSKKIYEVADELGFENAFYFSKVFKKVAGISPTEYMNQN